MKILFFLLTCFSLLSWSALGQSQRKFDQLHLRNQSTMEVKIIEIDATTVKYKKSKDLEGPLFTISKSELTAITYGNGDTETFQISEPVQEYFRPETADPKPVEKFSDPASSNPPSPRPRNGFETNLLKVNNERLQTFYHYHRKESKKGIRRAVIGISLGLLTTAIGTGLIVNTASYGPGIYSNQNEVRGAWLMIGGFALGATAGITGFIKAASNKNKAKSIQKELNRRNLPVQFGFAPSYDPRLKSGNLTLVASF
ncbi:hypothetical protein [Dyadobacter tibetensis]|uniref:hypothetical protein n=1 Tax=Dyadobacter tibetensis TaxID=1211851 RepID=UPI0004728D52|nr:hypothetical protein [Dyadobacter tibetensis]